MAERPMPLLETRIPDSLRAPFRWLIYLGIVANTAATILPIVAGILALIGFIVINLTSLRARFQEPSKGLLMLFTGLYLVRPSVLLLVLFTVYFQAIYFWGAKKPSHYLWIVAVGFVHLAVISTVMSSVAYPVVFLAYVVLLTHALLVANFLAGLQDEEGKLNQYELDRCEIGVFTRMRGISYWIAGISVVVAAIFFPVLPRFQAFSYQPTQFTGESVSGFSDEVTLGEMGAIQSDNRVALRIFLPPEFATRVRRWRGAVLEQWDFVAQRWSGSTRGVLMGSASGDHIFRNMSELSQIGRGIRVNASSMSNPRIFLPEVDGLMPWRVSSMESDIKGVFFDRDSWTLEPEDDLRFRGFEYNIHLLDEPSAEKAAPNPNSVSKQALNRCSTLDSVPDGFMTRLKERGDELVPGYSAGNMDPWEMAQRLNLTLQRSQGYTLDFTEPDSANSLNEFLFDQERGNCEYFATSLALLYRAYGIPARLVTGFQAGRENLFRNYQMVRQSDAHSWVEAYFEDRGWQIFDPTPSAPGTGGMLATQLGVLFDAYDFVQLQWNLYVLDYTQIDQRQFFASLFDKTGFMARPVFRLTRFLAAARQLIAGVLFVLFLIWLIQEISPSLSPWLQNWTIRLPGFRWLRWNRHASHLATRIFRRIEREASRRGVSRAPSETPKSFLDRLARSLPESSRSLDQFSKCYHRSRFGDPDMGIDGARELRRLLDELVQKVRGLK